MGHSRSKGAEPEIVSAGQEAVREFAHVPEGGTCANFRVEYCVKSCVKKLALVRGVLIEGIARLGLILGVSRLRRRV